MDILYLLDHLENLIASSRRMPLVNSILVKEGDILSIIDEMRTVIPDEIKQARRVIQEKERILAQANAEASTILSRARAESERAMNREGLLRSAEERSKEMVQRADQQAQELVQQAQQHTETLKIDADAYVSETLHNLREHLMSIETDVSRTILSIERGLDSIAEQDQEQESEEDNIPPPQVENALQEEQYDVEVDTEPTTGIQPRRASLANDTIGGPIFP